jgi:hypothetical protein
MEGEAESLRYGAKSLVDDLVAVVGLRDTQCSLGGCNVSVFFQGAFCQRP